MAIELLLTVHEVEWSIGGHGHRYWRLGPIHSGAVPREGDLVYVWEDEPELELEVTSVRWQWSPGEQTLVAGVHLRDVVLNPSERCWAEMDAVSRAVTLAGKRRRVPSPWTEDPEMAGGSLYVRLAGAGWEEA